MSVEVYEPVQLVVDNLVLQGTEANLVATNAVSKAYVDSHITSAVSNLVGSAHIEHSSGDKQCTRK